MATRKSAEQDMLNRISKLAADHPELRVHLVPILKQALDNNTFDLEIGEIGMKEVRIRGDQVDVYFPLSNIGKRGKMVEVLQLNIGPSYEDNIAYDWTFMDTVKKKKPQNLAALMEIWKTLETQALEKDPKRWVNISEGKRKGIDQSLPTPKAHMVEDIKGSDIYGDLNAKPIRFYIKSYAKELEKGRMVYWFQVHPRFKKRLQALASEIAAARGLKGLTKILNANKIPYDHHSYMDPMWD